MIIKAREDSVRDIATLEALLEHPSANADKRRLIEAQIRNIRAGVAGEADAAYHINLHFGQTPNWVVIHDLRVEHMGIVAQIDHLLINRLLEIWLLESKRFANGVKINEHGEFTTFSSRVPHGCDSPIEQNNRHMTVLRRVFNAGTVQWPTRLGIAIKPQLRPLVLISRGAIQRPANKIIGLDTVIKTDQLPTVITKSFEGGNPFDIAKIVGPTTLAELGRQIAALHRPAEFDWHRRFGLAPAAEVARSAPVASITRVAGLPITRPCATLEPAAGATPAANARSACGQCGAAVSVGVAGFCASYPERFGGGTYCMVCQPKVAPLAASRTRPPGETQRARGS